ncbi:gliding motility-associated C-terminal domain-containing protein [bacterium]|nr:gliding motility-associated C-terminal domain-containing protein [bacterium]
MRIITAICFIMIVSAHSVYSQGISDLASWSGNASWRGTAGARLGTALGTGDIVGDGLWDVVISAPGMRENAGDVYVFLGANTETDSAHVISPADSADIIIQGSAQTQLGIALLIADLNGDNFDDIIIGSPRAQDGRGEVWIVFGSPELGGTITTPDVLITGAAAGDACGKALAVTDTENDGFLDLLIGSPSADPRQRDSAGRVDILLGTANWQAEIDLQNDPHGHVIFGAFSGDQLGMAISVAVCFQGELFGNDLNDDGFGDVIISAPGQTAYGRTGAGVIHYFPNSEVLTDTVDLLGFWEQQNYKFIGGAQPLDQTGSSMASTFRLIDGGSLYIGAPNALYNFQRTGAVYEITWVELSLQQGPSVDLRTFGRYRTKFVSTVDEDSLGASIAAIDRLVMIASPGRQYLDRDMAGVVYRLVDRPQVAGIIALDTLRQKVRFTYGSQAGSELGRALAVADFNNDGKLDGILGSPRFTQFRGKAYYLKGGLPYLFDLDPRPSAQNVSVEDTLKLKVDDDEEGIEIDNFFVSLDNIRYESDAPQFSYEEDDGRFSLQFIPDDPFDLDVPIDVGLQFLDRSGNRSAFLSYQFITGRDNRAPVVSNLSPEIDESLVPTNTTVEFSIADPGSGVNIQSIRVIVEGDTARMGSPTLSITGIQENYYVIYNSVDDYEANSEIEVRIDAADLTEPNPNSMTPLIYSFFTIGDTIPPFVENIIPLEGEEIDVSSVISFNLFDDKTGIDTDSTFLRLIQDGDTSLVNPTFGNIIGGYNVAYQPSGGDGLYALGNLRVLFSSQDFANPANVLRDTSWTYTVLQDTLPPYLSNAIPHPDSVGAARNTPIILELSDDAAGIDVETLTLEVDGEPIPSGRIATQQEGHETVIATYQRLEGIYGDTVEVHVQVQDFTQQQLLLDSTYTFVTERDTISPEFVLRDPPPNIDGVSIDDSLVWEVADDLTGINIESAFLILKGQNKTGLLRTSTATETEEGQFRIVYEENGSFEYEDTLTVLIGISDNEEPPNETALNYILVTEPDEDPPYLTNLSPNRGQERVSRGRDIIFQVVDGGVGVLQDSIQLLVNSELISHDELYFEEIFKGYEVRYNPPGLFAYDDTVWVRVKAIDNALAANVVDETYYFTTLSDDHEPPYVQNVRPDFQSDLEIDFGFRFDVLDDGEGVDVDRTFVRRIGNQEWQDSTVVSDTIPHGYYFQVFGRNPYLFSDTIQFEIHTQDLAEPPNVPILPYEYTYYTTRDTTAPFIAEVFPLADSAITKNRFLEFVLDDALAGVDTAQVQLVIEGTNSIEDASRIAFGDGYKYRYRPTGAWNVGDSVHVEVRAGDFSRSLNILSYLHQFYVKPDLEAPEMVIGSLFPAPGDTLVQPDDTLQVQFEDVGLGIKPSSFQLFVQGKNYSSTVRDTILDPDSLSFRFKFPLEALELFEGQWIEVEFRVSDKALPPNTIPWYNYRFRIFPPDEDLAAVPTTFTPNGDGIWDETLIFHEGPPNTEVQIFDLRGRLIRKLQGNPASWNGIDENGEPVAGGLYIFQLEAGGKVRQGTVAVAR